MALESKGKVDFGHLELSNALEAPLPQSGDAGQDDIQVDLPEGVEVSIMRSPPLI
jgi:hypothetical protein